MARGMRPPREIRPRYRAGRIGRAGPSLGTMTFSAENAQAGGDGRDAAPQRDGRHLARQVVFAGSRGAEKISNAGGGNNGTYGDIHRARRRRP